MRGERLADRLFRVVILGFSAALLVLALFSQIRTVRTQSRIEELEKALARAENERVLLHVRENQTLSLEELERRALAMGMRHPEAGQIIEIEYLG